MNLRGARSEASLRGGCRATYLRKMLRKVLNLELSSGGFSADAPGVEARDAALEAAAEFVVEPGRAFSAARSAMVVGRLRAGVSLECCTKLRQAGENSRRAVAVRCPAAELALACVKL